MILLENHLKFGNNLMRTFKHMDNYLEDIVKEINANTYKKNKEESQKKNFDRDHLEKKFNNDFEQVKNWTQ